VFRILVWLVMSGTKHAWSANRRGPGRSIATKKPTTTRDPARDGE
jgi:hypothetical protein